MRIIDLDASGWTTVLDFYEALLAALEAPSRHGRNINALIDSMIWNEINVVQPPYTVRIHHLSGSAKEIIDHVELVRLALAEARIEYRSQHGRDVDVQLRVCLRLKRPTATP